MINNNDDFITLLEKIVKGWKEKKSLHTSYTDPTQINECIDQMEKLIEELKGENK